MGLNHLIINNIRNINNASITPNKNFNLIFGKNASGKSSFLEAIYILGTGNSFRTNKLHEFIAFEKDNCLVSGNVDLDLQNNTQMGISFSNSERIIKIDSIKYYTRAALAQKLPLQIIYPGSNQIIEGSPKIRRQFLDWGIFHLIPQYFSEWNRYRRALNQRNALLKSKDFSDMEIWDRELSICGTIVTNHRIEYLKKYKQYLLNICKTFLPNKDIQIKFNCGWKTFKTFEEILIEDRARDIKFGFTHSGPHRCDLDILVNGTLAKSFCSRGQIKLLVLAIKLAQINLQTKIKNQFGCLLIDDFCSELDKNNSDILIKYIMDLNLQCFITAIDKIEITNFYNENTTMFHVEHGLISTMTR